MRLTIDFSGQRIGLIDLLPQRLKLFLDLQVRLAMRFIECLQHGVLVIDGDVDLANLAFNIFNTFDLALHVAL